MTVHGTCPACHYLAPENKKTGQLRTDHLRRHILAKHPASEDAYPGVQGFENTKITKSLYLRGKGGKYEDGFCLDCGSWVSLQGIAQAHKAEAMRNHTCREKQVREYMNKLTANTDQEPAAYAQEKVLLKVFKQNGAEDFIEYKDNLDFDVGRTVARLSAAAKKPATAVSSVLERLKQEKRLAALGLGEREQLRRDAIATFNFEADSDDEDYEEEVFDEIADIIVPVLIEAAKSAGQRAQQSKIISDHAEALNKKDDEIDQLKCKLITKDREIQQLKESLCEDINEKDAEIARLNKVVREMTARLKSTEVVAPVPAPDTIQHQGGNTVGQWSLQYQG